MSDNNTSLSKIVFISIPESFERTIGDFRIDPSIRLPVELPENRDNWNVADLSWEMIVAGMLKVLSAEPDHVDADYYRDFIRAAKPSIVEELTETAILKARNRDFDIAEEIFRALRGLLPNDPRTEMNLALLYEQRADAYESIGNSDLQAHYYARAFDAYKELLRADTVLPEAHLNAGFFYLKQRSFDKAREHFTAYIAEGGDEEKIAEARKIVTDIDSQNLLDTLFKEAYDFIRLGKEEEGIVKIRKFLQTYPEVWNGWFLLGWGQRRLGRYAEAKTAFKRALELGPSQPDTLNELAICEMELNELDQAEKNLVKALRIEPENVKIMSNLGVLSLKRGNPSEASQYFQTVLEFEPDDPIARKYLAELS